MKQALALRPELGGDAFARPDGIVDVEIDPTTGLLATDKCPTRAIEYFIEGTQPEANCAGPHSGDHPPDPAIDPDLPDEQDDKSERPRRVNREPSTTPEEPRKKVERPPKPQ